MRNGDGLFMSLLSGQQCGSYNPVPIFFISCDPEKGHLCLFFNPRPVTALYLLEGLSLIFVFGFPSSFSPIRLAHASLSPPPTFPPSSD